MMLLPVAQLRLLWFLRMLPICATLHILDSSHLRSDRSLRLSLIVGSLLSGTGTLEDRSMKGPEVVRDGLKPFHQVLMGLGEQVGAVFLLQLQTTITFPDRRQLIKA